MAQNTNKKSHKTKSIAEAVATRPVAGAPLTITMTEFKQHLGKYINDLAHGTPLILTKNNKELTRLISPGADLASRSAKIIELSKKASRHMAKNHPGVTTASLKQDWHDHLAIKHGASVR